MTTTDVIKKAKKLASKYFIVESIQFRNSIDFLIKSEDISLTTFYKKNADDNDTSNFTVHVFLDFDALSTENLFYEYKSTLIKLFQRQNKEQFKSVFDVPESSIRQPETSIQ